MKVTIKSADRIAFRYPCSDSFIKRTREMAGQTIEVREDLIFHDHFVSVVPTGEVAMTVYWWMVDRVIDDVRDSSKFCRNCHYTTSTNESECHKCGSTDAFEEFLTDHFAKQLYKRRGYGAFGEAA